MTTGKGWTNDNCKKVHESSGSMEFIKAFFQEIRTDFTNYMDNERRTLKELQENMTLPSVAFYAHHVTDLVLDVTGEIIIFDSTMTNEGSGYDTSTGIFTAPVGGMYQFTVHICTSASKYSYVGLVLEGNIMAKASSYGKSHYSCTSFGAIARVKSGEQVSVKCLTNSMSNYRLSEDSWTRNTFSGILLNK